MFLLPNSRYKCKRVPVATAIVVACSALLWLVVWMSSYPPQVFAAYGFVAAKPHAVCLVSAIFLHQGIIFVLPNMIFLSVLGKQLEDALGRSLFLAVFVLSGVTGTALFYALDRTSTIPCTGSAGARRYGGIPSAPSFFKKPGVRLKLRDGERSVCPRIFPPTLNRDW